MYDEESWGITSEVGALQLALVHQPGYEHRHTIPWNKDALLFDDILDVEEARPEHKEFTRLLSAHGVEVIYFLDLLKDVCSADDYASILREALSPSLPRSSDVSNLKPIDLIHGTASQRGADQPPNLEPLPNLYFTRDAMFSVPGAIVLSRPARLARRREANLMHSVLKRHPRFIDAPLVTELLDDPEVTIEGGDVLVADPTTVLIGIGERTNEKGANKLAHLLQSRTTVTRVAKIFNPPRRDFMHLDTVMTFVDRKRLLTLPYLWDRPDLYAEVASRCRRVSQELGEPYTGPLPDAFSQTCRLEIVEGAEGTSREYDNVIEGLVAEGVVDGEGTILVGGPRHHYATPEDHIIEALREQWNDGANVLALKPGQVVALGRNDRTFRALEEQGIEVLSFSGGELVRGRGGPRAMASPLRRL